MTNLYFSLLNFLFLFKVTFLKKVGSLNLISQGNVGLMV